MIRKLHIYFGLLTFSQLFLYGLAGLVATVQTARERPKNIHAERAIPFQAPASATDKEVARRVYEQLQLPLTRPMPDWFLQRTTDNHLLLDFYNINGIYRVIVREDRGDLQIQHIRNSIWLYLGDMHAVTIGDREAPRLIRAWAIWNEVGIWSLIGFCLSGMWMWWTARARNVWSWAALALGTAWMLVLWRMFR